MSRKKNIAIFVILTVFALGLGVYFAWRKSREILNPPPPTGETGLPAVTFRSTSTLGEGVGAISAPAAQVAALSDQPVLGYWITRAPQTSASRTLQAAPASGDRILYINEKGHIYEVKDGNDEMIGAQDVEDIRGVKSSPDGRFVLVRSGASIRLFNIEAKTWRDLSRGITGAFSPDSKRLVYLRAKEGTVEIDLVLRDIAAPRQTEQILITAFFGDVDLGWSGGKIFFNPKPSASYDGELWAYDTAKRTLGFFASGDGLMLAWSPNGKTGLRFRLASGIPELHLVDRDGVVTANVGVATLPSKCSFAGDSLYCAIPIGYNSAQDPLLPDDYLKRAAYSTDSIYRLSTAENIFDPVFLPSDTQFDAINLQLSGNRLLFMNRYDNKIYGLVIRQISN
ncbi:hypothetical protein HY504_02215 [Candidatus Wolfebacteria bacterium]|nr:hypothetical protein [Candidatus Wolfebacteria bacterium]